MRAVLLLSGGLDSYTAGAIAKSEGFDLCALSILYGQRHSYEIVAARRVAAAPVRCIPHCNAQYGQCVATAGIMYLADALDRARDVPAACPAVALNEATKVLEAIGGPHLCWP